jgi:hypothetical protein
MKVLELLALSANGPDCSHRRSGEIEIMDQSAISQEGEVKLDRPVSSESER